MKYTHRFMKKNLSFCPDLLHRLGKTCASEMFLLKLQWKWRKATLRVNIDRSQKRGGLWCAVSFVEMQRVLLRRSGLTRGFLSHGNSCPLGESTVPMVQAGADSDAAYNQHASHWTVYPRCSVPTPVQHSFQAVCFILRWLLSSGHAAWMQWTELSFELAWCC